WLGTSCFGRTALVEARYGDRYERMIRLPLPRIVAAIGVAFAVFAADVSAAHAQSSSCQRLESTLANLDRNRDFRN
ncbi:unnamed protein product, partial [Laminaria digitata]